MAQMSKDLHFQVNVLSLDAQIGYLDNRNEYEAMINILTNGTSDLGMGFFLSTVERFAVVDFTVPIISSKPRLYLKKSQYLKSQWKLYFMVKNLKILKNSCLT